jgi:hypothetical protein
MKTALEVIAKTLRWTTPGADVVAQVILDDLEAEGLVVIDRRTLLLINGTHGVMENSQ